MTVTTSWIERGKILKVGEAGVMPQDILEFAEALIEEEGWRDTHAGENAGDGASAPWTIHQAIGEAARRMEPVQETARKDGPVARPLRDTAAQLLYDVHGKTDIELNDEATTQDEALAFMRAAREA